MYKIIVDKKLRHKYRFEMNFEKGSDEECWTWKGLKSKKGYGSFAFGKYRSYYAHRFSYELYLGAIPENKLVCHSCDNRSCVNPNHLWIGTIKENNLDRDKKGRFVAMIGENHPQCKINENTAKEIKARIRTGEPMIKIAKELNISYRIVANIKAGIAWRHI